MSGKHTLSGWPKATKHYSLTDRAEPNPSACCRPQPFQARTESRNPAPLSKSFSEKAFILNVWAISTLLSWEPKVIEISIIHQHIISQNKEIPLEQIVFNSEADQKEPNALLWLPGAQTCWKCAVSSQYSRQRGQNRVQTGPPQNVADWATSKQGTDQKDTCPPESNTIPDGRFFTTVPNKPKAVSVWRLFRPLGRAEGPVPAPCAQAASLVESVRSWIINRVNVTLKPTPSLHWAENHQWPAPRAPISLLILVDLFACLVQFFESGSYSFHLNRPWILQQWPCLCFSSARIHAWATMVCFWKTQTVLANILKQIKNDLGFRNLCFSNHKGTECWKWKSYVALQVKTENVRTPLQIALRQLLLVISHIYSCL